MDACKTTPLGKLSIPDWVKSLIVAVISAPLAVLIDNAQAFMADPNKPFSIHWKLMLASAIVSGGAYLVKNLLTGSGGQLLSNNPQPGGQAKP